MVQIKKDTYFNKLSMWGNKLKTASYKIRVRKGYLLLFFPLSVFLSMLIPFYICLLSGIQENHVMLLYEYTFQKPTDDLFKTLLKIN